MINLKVLREFPREIGDSLKNRKSKINMEEIISSEIFCRESNYKIESLTAAKNILSKKISILLRDNNVEEIELNKKETSIILVQIKKIKNELKEVEINFNKILLTIPNVLDKSVPIGNNEDDNVEVRKVNEVRQFSFKPKEHWELGRDLNIIDLERAAIITGSRFSIYKGKGAKLMRAIQNLTLDIHEKNGFEEYILPVLVNEKSLTNTAQLPIMVEDVFKVDFKDYFLSPTLEVQLTNLFSNQIINEEVLPIKVTSSSLNFRAEAGAAGKDVKGLIRQHQFLKTEMVIISNPKNSFDELEKMVANAEEILKVLELPYRVIVLCSADTGFASSKTYDIEVYIPAYNNYREISSCSNCTDFQSRRAKIRFRSKDNENNLTHTLNGSGLALDRLWVAVVENYQQKDGSIKIPKALKKYLNFDVI